MIIEAYFKLILIFNYSISFSFYKTMIGLETYRQQIRSKILKYTSWKIYFALSEIKILELLKNDKR